MGYNYALAMSCIIWVRFAHSRGREETDCAPKLRQSRQVWDEVLKWYDGSKPNSQLNIPSHLTHQVQARRSTIRIFLFLSRADQKHGVSRVKPRSYFSRHGQQVEENLCLKVQSETYELVLCEFCWCPVFLIPTTLASSKKTPPFKSPCLERMKKMKTNRTKWVSSPGLCFV